MNSASPARIKPIPTRKIILSTFVVALGFASWVWHSGQANQRSVSLGDGPCEILEVIDPLTFRVKIQDSRQPREVLFRLSGIQLNSHTDVAQGQSARQFIDEFIDGRQPHLRFDRQRYDDDNRALGYLVIDSRMLNVALVENGFANPAPVRGNSISIQRQIAQAAEQRMAAR